MKDILESLEDIAQKETPNIEPQALVLRGIWKCQYVLQLTAEESVFNLNYVLAQTVGQGCCYYDPKDEEPEINEDLIGRNILKAEPESRPVRIACLDAVFASINGKRKPNASHVLEGSNIVKAHQRAEIVCAEAFRLLSNRGPKRGNKKVVLNVGVVGSLVSILSKNADLEVRASDLYDGVIGKEIHGVVVEDGTRPGSKKIGDRTLELIAEADLAVVTGMTLANGTLDGILAVARETKTALVLFAETGANFASQYCDMGIDSVVSEPFPFYLTSAGPTRINIYRRSES